MVILSNYFVKISNNLKSFHIESFLLKLISIMPPIAPISLVHSPCINHLTLPPAVTIYWQIRLYIAIFIINQ
jgi:hypothetical protein